MLEQERKYEVDPAFRLPDLSATLPPGGRIVQLPPATLTATYFDAPDLRLARAGVSLRFREGDADPWTVKLPTDAPGTRHEISRQGVPDKPPADLVALVTAYSRGARLTPAAVVRTVRQAYELRDDHDRPLAELADDSVSVLAGRTAGASFREIEVEREDGDAELLDRVESVLCDAGAKAGGFTPKHVRAMGPQAADAPDLVGPSDLPADSEAGEVVTAAIRRGVGRVLAHDPLVRLRAPVGDDDTGVHQMRVGCRRLRSDLRTFRPLLDGQWAGALRDELKWLADALGAARDVEVLRTRLRATAAADPISPLDDAAVARVDTVLAERHDAALSGLDEVMRSDRYAALVESLVAASREPRLTELAGSPATQVLPRLVRKPWRRLVRGRKGAKGAADLEPEAPDGEWHAVRINGKKARYAVEAIAPVVGDGAPMLAKALSKVQDVLGEHQDGVVAAQTWLSIAESEPADHDLAVTAGRLCERERTAVRDKRAAFPKAWRRATKRRRTRWLP